MFLFDKVKEKQATTKIQLVAEITTYLHLASQDFFFLISVRWGCEKRNFILLSKVLAQLISQHVQELI